MENFRNLKVWEDAYQLSLLSFRRTAHFSWRDRYLMDQLRRASYSISSNIAEGCGKSSKKDQAHYFQVSFGSACEVEHHLEFLLSTELLPKKEFDEMIGLTIGVKKMLTGLLKYKRRA